MEKNLPFLDINLFDVWIDFWLYRCVNFFFIWAPLRYYVSIVIILSPITRKDGIILWKYVQLSFLMGMGLYWIFSGASVEFDHVLVGQFDDSEGLVLLESVNSPLLSGPWFYLGCTLVCAGNVSVLMFMLSAVIGVVQLDSIWGMRHHKLEWACTGKFLE